MMGKSGERGSGISVLAALDDDDDDDDDDDEIYTIIQEWWTRSLEILFQGNQIFLKEI